MHPRSNCLWQELAHLEERRGKGVFTGEYTWTHYGSYSRTFDAGFVRLLNETEWLPDEYGNLSRPSAILFDSLDWKPDPFLLSKIRFRPPIIDQLAKEAGFDPGVLDLLKQRGITSAAQLRELLGVEAEPPDNDDGPGGAPAGGGGSRTRGGSGGAGAPGGGQREGLWKGRGKTGGKRPPGSVGGRPFISYVGVNADEKEPDPDGLDHTARMALEASAIECILEQEPDWQRTPTSNPGYDLFHPAADGKPARWCEVKAMTGGLKNRPVGLSRSQFECAGKHGDAYWLYVVEKAATKDARIVRIQDPAGKARTFTFDRGWLGIAVDAEQENTED